MKPHDIRLRLYENGYKPLPLTGKACYLENWGSDVIDLDRVNSWRRKHSPNAGIRCDNIAVIDLDITDEDLLDAAFDLVMAKLGPTPLERIGNAPKVALVYRLDEVASKTRTGKYGEGHEVEFLAGPGCQMAAIGIHPGTGKPYDWGDSSPMDIHRDDLPIVDFDDVIALRDEIVVMFESRGLEMDEGDQFSPTDSCEHDLEFNMEFETREYGIMSAADIQAMLQSRGGTIRVNPTGFRSDSTAFACVMSIGEQGLHLTDFPQAITHYLKDDTAEKFAALLPELPQDHPAVAPPVESKLEPILDLVNNWVHVAVDNSARHVDRPYKAVSMSAFFNQHKYKVGKDWLVDAWLARPDTLKAGDAAMTPSEGAGLFSADDGEQVLNTYCPPVHGGGSHGEAAPFIKFISRLLPNSDERELFMDWLAHKVQNPDVRAHAVVMVAKEYGTGRGTLFGILKKLFGSKYVTPNIELADFLGTSAGSQSQYNEYMAGSLMVCVAEAKAAGSTSWHDGNEVMERLKERIDTQASDLHVKRKRIGNSFETTYASVIIATQHADALPIPSNDRRLIVLTNGVPINVEDALEINAWMDDKTNVAALYDLLKGRSVSYHPHGVPPMTEGKLAMINAAKSALDQLAETYIKEALGAVCYLQQFKQFCVANQDSVDGELPQVIGDKVLYSTLSKYGAEKGPKMKISAAIGKRTTWVLRPNLCPEKVARPVQMEKHFTGLTVVEGAAKDFRVWCREQVILNNGQSVK